MREVVFVALGSNLGDREAHLAFARARIAALPGTRILDATIPEETPAFGPPGQSAYLNQMIAFETALPPHDLLTALQGIEHEAGRTRALRWGPRTLDLDIVRFGDREIADERLVVPHPGLRDRDFWQRELRSLTMEPR
jgi:2-amino-4-hydroxy-6-hydroxymethyldihydropteridine diphosphokinase